MEPTHKPSRFERVWHLLGVIGIGGTGATLTSGWFWLTDVTSQLSVQFLLLSLLALPLWCYRRKRRLIALATIAVTVNLWLIVPYFLPNDARNGSGKSWRLTIFNVLRTNREIESTIAEATASDPDFLFLMEVSDDWSQPLAELKERYPHQKLICRADYTGVAFLSKHRWRQLEVISGPDANSPLDVSFVSEQSEFRLLLTHPLPPLWPHLSAARDDQLQDLAERISDDVPTLLAGDFNQTPWSFRFRALLGKYNLSDGSMGFGAYPTLTPLPTWFGGVKVDHVLTNRSVSVVNFEIGETNYSDHRPVVVDFTTRP